ncbi:hypothetical protein N0V85_002667 [Neurospora sp. IMI 360204]|nr:hypothetical protein N0V85_002667 [Neurospora sp. IMI 360204]
MVNLRQLSVSLYYSAWHPFLQSLPNMPQIHAIDIPHVAEYSDPTLHPNELALYIADILTVRPEVRLKYAGICHTCFEFWEHRRVITNRMWSGSEVDTAAAFLESWDNNGNWGSGEADDDDDDGEDDDSESSSSEEEDDEDEDEEGDITDDIELEGFHMDEDDDHLVHGASSDSEDSDEDNTREEDDGFYDSEGRVVIRVREITFEEDKVEIFRARHMKL